LVLSWSALFLWYATGVEMHHLFETGEHHDHESTTSLCSSELHPECALCWAVVAPALEAHAPLALVHPGQVPQARVLGYESPVLLRFFQQQQGRAPPLG
jgi:hypothetical protein